MMLQESVLRRAPLNLAAPFIPNGKYRYTNGFILAGVTALALAVLPNLPGFPVNVKWARKVPVPALFVGAYDYA